MSAHQPPIGRLSLGEIAAIAMITQALVTGVYLASFLLCLRWLVFSDGGGTLRKHVNWSMLAITIILFAFSVTDFGLSLRSTLLIIRNQDRHNNMYTNDITNIVEMLTSIIIDSVLIFRCWTVFKKSWLMIVFPILLLLYNVSTLVILTYWYTMIILPKKNRLASTQSSQVQGAYYASTVALNIYATSAIIFQTWRSSMSRGPRASHFIIRVIAESGLLYTLSGIAVLCMLFINLNHVGVPISSAINFPMAGIAFNLILIRVSQMRAKPEGMPTLNSDSALNNAIPTISQPTLETQMVTS